MAFNPDPSKQAVEVVFSHKRNKKVYPVLHFNNTAIDQEAFPSCLPQLEDSASLP